MGSRLSSGAMYVKCLAQCFLRRRSRRLVSCAEKESRNEIAEPRTDLLVTRVIGVLTCDQSLYGVGSGNVPNPTDPTTAGPRWPSALFPESPRKPPASKQRRRLCERGPFLTATKSVRSGKGSGLESQTGWSCSDPPWPHSMPCPDALCTAVELVTVTPSTSFSCGSTSVLRSKRSFTGCPRFCLQPR